MVKPSATGQDFIGITQRRTIVDPLTVLGATDGIPATDPANVKTSGRIWVHAEVAIALGDGVFFRHTAGGGGSVVGRFRNDADTASADEITTAKWLSTTGGVDELALLELFHV